MDELLKAFALGNSAILTNVCMLPLYPGLIAFMAGRAGENRGVAGWLGLIVLTGVLSMMLLIGWLLSLFQASFGAVLPVLLPVIYGVVLLMGVLLIIGKNPFARVAALQSPAARNPFLRAYLYGFLLAPMTLPCTGPLIVSVFMLGANSTTALANGLLYFLAFGLGFGWPLVLLPLLARASQKRFTGWLTHHHRLLERLSGILLILIGVYGLLVEYLPNLLTNR